MEDGQQQQSQWIVVKSRKRKHIEKEVKPEKVFTKGANVRFSKDVNLNLHEQFLEHTTTEINSKAINTVFGEIRFGKVEVHCLGIGNFSSYLKPQLQMLFLRHCIIDQLSSMSLEYKLNIFDPIFSQEQLQQIRGMGASSEQFLNVEMETSYVMFMPHCDRFLHERLCQLKLQQPSCQIIVIGNSINEYKQRCQYSNENIPQTLNPFSPKQTKLKDFKQAFNDTYIYTL